MSKKIDALIAKLKQCEKEILNCESASKSVVNETDIHRLRSFISDIQKFKDYHGIPVGEPFLEDYDRAIEVLKFYATETKESINIIKVSKERRMASDFSGDEMFTTSMIYKHHNKKALDLLKDLGELDE